MPARCLVPFLAFHHAASSMLARSLFRPFCLAVFAVGLLAGCGPSSDPGGSTGGEPGLPYGVTQLRQGAPSDATPSLNGPSLMLQGDGAPLRAAFRAHVRAVAAGPVDVVVLAASEAGGPSRTPECDAVGSLSRVHSCTTVVLPDARGASLEAVAATVRDAEVVYFAGGNQCNYVKWAGRAVLEAVADLGARGGGVGGGSAGLAIQGDAAYDGCTGSVSSEEALSDPYHEAISFSDGPFDWPALERLITDSHFVERDRMGRLLAFLARLRDEQDAAAFYGLGIDGGAAVVVDASGRGRVYGGRAYLARLNRPADTLRAGRPLTARGIAIRRLAAGDTLDLTGRAMEPAYRRSVEAGTLSADPYAP